MRGHGVVRNSDIKLEFNLFADIWTTYKSLLPVGLRDNEAYWGKNREPWLVTMPLMDWLKLYQKAEK